jgi:hypothetical protein
LGLTTEVTPEVTPKNRPEFVVPSSILQRMAAMSSRRLPLDELATSGRSMRLHSGMIARVKDAQIRAATKTALFLQHVGDATTVIFEELGVQHGSARIDLAVVNGELQGFELKSDRDTLSRLPEQAEAFGRVFDRVTLVVGERLLRRAVEVVPDWWGIRVARMEGADLAFSDLRLAFNNPTPDATSIARLLWRDEALNLLDKCGSATGVRSKGRTEIYSRVCEKVSLDDLRYWVRRCLRQRRDWRSVATRLSCGG